MSGPMTFDQMLNGDGFRFYRYDPGDGSDPIDLLSVTSIRNLCGEGWQLVNWKMANLADAALGTMKRTKIGPRGGVKEVRQVFEFPSEFARMYAESNGEQEKIDGLRTWLRDRADEPRNIAAVRGTLTHEPKSAIQGGHQAEKRECTLPRAQRWRETPKDRRRRGPANQNRRDCEPAQPNGALQMHRERVCPAPP